MTIRNDLSVPPFFENQYYGKLIGALAIAGSYANEDTKALGTVYAVDDTTLQIIDFTLNGAPSE